MDIQSPCDALFVLRRIREHAAHDPTLDHNSDDYRAFRSATAKAIAQLILASSRIAPAEQDTIDKLTGLLGHRG